MPAVRKFSCSSLHIDIAPSSRCSTADSSRARRGTHRRHYTPRRGSYATTGGRQVVHSGVPRLREGRCGMPEDLRCAAFIRRHYIDMQTAEIVPTRADACMRSLCICDRDISDLKWAVLHPSHCIDFIPHHLLHFHQVLWLAHGPVCGTMCPLSNAHEYAYVSH